MSDQKPVVDEWRAEQRDRVLELRGLMLDEDVKHIDVAFDLGMSQSTFSGLLSTRVMRRWPEGFERRVRDAIKARGGVKA